MYIAFKWLLSLTLAMWLTMCGIDVMVKRHIELKHEGFNQEPEITMNISIPHSQVELQAEIYYEYKHIKDKPHRVAILPWFMFLAGALVVSLYNRKDEIILYTKRKISKVSTEALVKRFQEYSKITVRWACDCSILYSKMLWLNLNNGIIRLKNKLNAFVTHTEIQKPRINVILLKKLQEIGEERKHLGQLLIAAIHENKNIRMQYELESLAKNRLVQHIENTQKVIRENRSRYVSFQQLYLITHQENSFLKSRIKRLTKDKEEAEKNLFELMNEVYKSQNNKLKAYCSKFIVKTSNNLLNADVGAEIQKFLNKSRTPAATTSNWQLTERPDIIKVGSTSSWPTCANPRFAEIVQDDILIPLVSDAPKLKGLPGEFVWTVKDKDGLIEKLYEYDYESDLDDGETIRRIRQYSVYFDKDCLLDFGNSRTVINETRPTASRMRGQRDGADAGPLTTHGFLTGSEAFQKFMQNNRNVVSISSPRLPVLPMPMAVC